MVNIYPSAIHMVIGGGIPSEFNQLVSGSSVNGDNEGDRTGKSLQALAHFITQQHFIHLAMTRGVGNVGRGQAKK
jgi:hypothetical protein